MNSNTQCSWMDKAMCIWIYFVWYCMITFVHAVQVITLLCYTMTTRAILPLRHFSKVMWKHSIGLSSMNSKLSILSFSTYVGSHAFCIFFSGVWKQACEGRMHIRSPLPRRATIDLPRPRKGSLYDEMTISK